MLSKPQISLYKLHHNDVNEWMDFAWHYSPARVKHSFSKAGILVEDDADVEALIELAKSGGDVRGEMKDKDGKAIKFSVLDVVKSTDINVAEMDNKFASSRGNMLLKVNKRLGKS
jgi:hypothetical protein